MRWLDYPLVVAVAVATLVLMACLVAKPKPRPSIETHTPWVWNQESGNGPKATVHTATINTAHASIEIKIYASERPHRKAYLVQSPLLGGNGYFVRADDLAEAKARARRLIGQAAQEIVAEVGE